MASIANKVLLDGEIVDAKEARLSVASSAVLYGLSVYSVFFAKHTKDDLLCFRVADHWERLRQSARIIGLTDAEELIKKTDFLAEIKKLAAANQPTTDQFFRVTIHASEEIPGVRTDGLKLSLSIFMYEAKSILPHEGSRLKTSLWRRTADNAIPARAKVNGAYVNSALAKQDAIDGGYDDCLFLNQSGYVSELSAANIFMVKNGTLITPDSSSDILEGITRRSIIEIAASLEIPVVERKVALTELYTADEAFACGTSAFVSPIVEIDKRTVGQAEIGPVTEKLKRALVEIQSDPQSSFITVI